MKNTDKQIIIKDYFNIMRDDYGRIYCIQDIGDSKELIKAIREQNEYIQRKEQECEELKHDNGYEVGALEKTIDNLKAENKHLNELLNQALKDYDRTLNALAEIKEIAYELTNEEYTEFIEDKQKQILQKISECEGKDE